MSETSKYEKMYHTLVDYETMIHEKNQKRIKYGLRCGIIIPLVFMNMLFWLGGSKVIYMTLWIGSLFVISGYLILVEYADIKIQKLLKEVQDENLDEVDALIGGEFDEMEALAIERAEEVAKAIEEQKEAIVERREERKEAFAEKIEEQKGAIAEKIEGQKGAIAERHEERVEVISEKIEERKSELGEKKNEIEEKLQERGILKKKDAGEGKKDSAPAEKGGEN